LKKHRATGADHERTTAVRTTLKRRIAKLESAFRPPTRIVFHAVIEKPGLQSERFVSREEYGNVIFETWEGPIKDPSSVQPDERR
jgi:hypothetical protein